MPGHFSETWKQGNRPTLSFEFYPPRDESGMQKLLKPVSELCRFNPDFVSVTFGAGGSSREGSFELIRMLKSMTMAHVMAYFAGYGLSEPDARSVLDRFQELGVATVLCVRGDPPAESSATPIESTRFKHASDLIEFTHRHYRFLIGAAGYPEGHKDCTSLDRDIEYLRQKVTRGAEFIITQYCYRQERYHEFIRRCNRVGINVPIIAGIMPIYTTGLMKQLAGLCGASIPAELESAINRIPEGDKDALSSLSLNLLKQQAVNLIQNKVHGLHFYTLNRSKLLVELLESLQEQGILHASDNPN